MLLIITTYPFMGVSLRRQWCSAWRISQPVIRLFQPRVRFYRAISDHSSLESRQEMASGRQGDVAPRPYRLTRGLPNEPTGFRSSSQPRSSESCRSLSSTTSLCFRVQWYQPRPELAPRWPSETSASSAGAGLYDSCPVSRAQVFRNSERRTLTHNQIFAQKWSPQSQARAKAVPNCLIDVFRRRVAFIDYPVYLRQHGKLNAIDQKAWPLPANNTDVPMLAKKVRAQSTNSGFVELGRVLINSLVSMQA